MSSPAPPPPFLSFVTLTEAKEQLGIDPDLTIHDAMITRKIGAAIDWAENFTGRSLGMLLELNSPADSPTTPLPDPLDSPHYSSPPPDVGVVGVEGWDQGWTMRSYQEFYGNNPQLADNAPLTRKRRDVKEAILLRIELLFDRNTDNWKLIDDTTTDMLMPYRLGMGV